MSAIPFWVRIVLALVISFVITYLSTPHVKHFAEKVGAMDVPKDERRVHNHPIPRMGGIAIFLGFVCAVALMVFDEVSADVLGLLIGASIIAVMGAADDIANLNAYVKFAVQIVAAVVAIRSGLVFDVVTNFFGEDATTSIGWLSIPVTLIWIVGCTNAVNLIDGLDGLAAGVSAISSVTMLVVSLFVSNPVCTIILAAVAGSCFGFLPYNKNPAQIFMGDVGSQTLGFILACVSIMGSLKFHTAIAFFVPILAMAFPIADTTFAFTRRIIHGQSPFKADKKHFHHRLLALGLSQKQAVAVLYAVSAILGLIAVVLVGESPAFRITCIVIAAFIALAMWFFIARRFLATKTDEAIVGENIEKESDSND